MSNFTVFRFFFDSLQVISTFFEYFFFKDFWSLVWHYHYLLYNTNDPVKKFHFMKFLQIWRVFVGGQKPVSIPGPWPGGFVRFPPEDLHRRRIRFAATFRPPDFPRLVATLAGSSFSWLMQKKGKKMPEVSGKSL